MALINRNPDATNSELDAKQIVTNKELNPKQRDELIEQYVELVVDNMDTKSLVQFVTEELEIRYRNDYTDVELKEEINIFGDELYDELVENIQITDLMKEREDNGMQPFIPNFHD
mgnify:CR=1 FL=1